MKKKLFLSVYYQKASSCILNLHKENDHIIKAVNLILTTIKKNKNILVAGNGGSFSDAEHFACELSCTFKEKRRALPAIALGSNASSITAWSNDFGFETYFSRQVEALGKSNDILFLISTGGNQKGSPSSLNLLHALRAGKKKKMKIISLVGKGGGRLKKESDVCIHVKHKETSTVQETHITILHSICSLIDQNV